MSDKHASERQEKSRKRGSESANKVFADNRIVDVVLSLSIYFRRIGCRPSEPFKKKKKISEILLRDKPSLSFEILVPPPGGKSSEKNPNIIFLS